MESLAELASCQLADATVRWTVRLSVLCYVARLAVDLVSGRSTIRVRAARLARSLWIIGAVLFTLHVVAAFGLVHDWSHARAWVATAEQTEDAIGVRSGAGLYANYLFGLVWIVDAVVWRRSDPLWAYRSPIRYWTIQSFFAFMVFNATVVFGPPWWRPVFVLVAIGSLLILPLRFRFRLFG